MNRRISLYPEKLLFLMSGVMFIIMTTPAWIPGFAAAIAAAGLWSVILCLLPVEKLCLQKYMLDPGFWMLGLVVNIGFGCNFYNNWADSRNMLGIANVIGLPLETFVKILAVVFAVASSPAVGCVLRYLVKSAQYDYRQTVGKTRKPGSGIPAGKAVLILSVLYILGISAILRTNFYYQDDMSRAAYGYKQWDYFGRYLSTALATLIHTGDYLTDIAPLPQILAMVMMAAAGVLILYVVLERSDFSLWELAAVIPLGLNPYFLECISFRFDAPYMAVSVLAGVVPLLYRKKRLLVYLFASILGILAVCTSYQPATGIFPMLVILLALRMWNQGETIRKVMGFCIKSVAGYGAGLVYFKCIIMKPADAGYVSNTLPPIPELLPNTMDNLKRYFGYILTDYKPLWIGLVLLIAVGCVYELVKGSERKGAAVWVMTIAALLMMTLLCFGIYPVLANTLFAPRAMYGFGVLIALLAVVAAEGKILQRVPVIGLCWCFFVFSFTYGNALNLQKEYTDFRIEAVIEDLNDLEVFQTGEDVTVQISGSIGKAPVIRNMPQNYQMLNRLVPETFSGADDLTQARFFYYYDLRNVRIEASEDMRKLDLPVLEEHMYHTIRGEGNRILIELK